MLLTLIELIFVTYCLVYLIGFLILDCDFWLAFLELFGNNIGKFCFYQEKRSENPVS